MKRDFAKAVLGWVAILSALAALAYMLPLRSQNRIPAEDVKKWFTEIQTARSKLISILPPGLLNGLEAADPDFCFVPLSMDAKNAVATGDFNCDGLTDYAVTGVPKSDSLGRSICGTASSDTQDLAAAREDFLAYSTDQPAMVRIGLSSATGLAWQKERGSHVSYAGSACRCCHSVTDRVFNDIKKASCGFVYVSCCGEDGRYLLWETNSASIKYDEGC